MNGVDMEINIQSAAEGVAREYGYDVVESVFARYDATCFENLNPYHYDEVFGDLLMILDDD